MSPLCIKGWDRRPDNNIVVNKNASQSGSLTVGSKARGAWEFINLSTPQDAKVASLRRTVRVKAARGLQPKSRIKERTHRPYADAPLETQTVVPEQSEVTTANHAIPHPGSSPLPKQAPRWPNQLEQLILEADLVSKSLTPATSREYTEDDDDFTHDTYARMVSDLLSPVTKPDCSLGSGIADPFDAFPSKHCAQDYKMVSHFCNVLAPICLPIDRRSGVDVNPLRTFWIPLMMNDLLLFEATATAMAAHLDVLHGRKEHPETIIRKARTIKMINERLKYKETASSDSMIGAVEMLASAERHAGRLDEVRIHEAAIRKMINIRGGIKRLKSGVLLMWLNWGDCVTSTMLGSRPQLGNCFYDDWLGDEQIYANMPAVIAPLKATPLVSLSCIFQQLRYLTDQMIQTYSDHNRISDHDMRGFIKARNTIERSLLSLAPSPSTGSSSSLKFGTDVAKIDYAFEAHRVSSLIYLNIILRDCNPAGALLRALFRQLCMSIKAAETSTTSKNRLRHMPTTLWVYVMGGLLSLDDTDQQWFATRIKKMMKDMGITAWADVEGVLRQAVWVDTLKTKTKNWETLWQRVQDSTIFIHDTIGAQGGISCSQ